VYQPPDRLQTVSRISAFFGDPVSQRMPVRANGLNAASVMGMHFSVLGWCLM
jgi:hypothetical protein